MGPCGRPTCWNHIVHSPGKTTAHWLATRVHVGAAEAKPACPRNTAARDTSRPITECLMMSDEALVVLPSWGGNKKEQQALRL